LVFAFFLILFYLFLIFNRLIIIIFIACGSWLGLRVRGVTSKDSSQAAENRGGETPTGLLRLLALSLCSLTRLLGLGKEEISELVDFIVIEIIRVKMLTKHAP